MAKLTGNPAIEIWGDGEQTRSFCYIDDCVNGIDRLMQSDFHQPINLGQDRMVTINQLAEMVGDIAGVRLVKKHVPGPMGVRGSQLRQHAVAPCARLGARDLAGRRSGADLPVD
jgi:nucleoside-diphosphate-sugar epimerase